MTHELTLVEVLRRLREREEVRGILWMGWMGTGRLTPQSNDDLLLVLAHRSAPTKRVTTWINDHVADVYCTTVAGIERALAEAERWTAGSEEEALIRWLRGGRVQYDRSGVLRQGPLVATRLSPAVP